MKTLYCSFCGKEHTAVAYLIAGPAVWICNECVELCVDIINEQRRAKRLSGTLDYSGASFAEPPPLDYSGESFR